MASEPDLLATDIEAYLAAHERKSLLRFLTCGSVDDGKSTLIGRLLYDSKMIFEDQLAALEAVEGLPPLRSAQFAFVGPATGEVRAVPTLLRQGKSATSVAVKAPSGPRLPSLPDSRSMRPKVSRVFSKRSIDVPA